MMKSLVCALLAGLAMPVLAAEATLSLPTDARLDVQVIDRVTLDKNAPGRTDVLLRPVMREQSGATHRLPDYCLITANAQIEDQRVRLTTQAVTCIEAEGDNREIFSGELSAAAYERDGGFGLDACTERQNGECRHAVIEPEHHFQLRVGRNTELSALENPSQEINERRRQADGEGVANPIPAERPDPDTGAE